MPNFLQDFPATKQEKEIEKLTDKLLQARREHSYKDPNPKTRHNHPYLSLLSFFGSKRQGKPPKNYVLLPRT